MKWQRLLFWSLFLLLAALVLDLLIGQKVASEGSELWSGRLRDGGAILLGIAGILWLLEKVGLRVSGARCKDCKRSIPHGHVYCRDHFRKHIEEGREKLHQYRGTGV